jgi:integrase
MGRKRSPGLRNRGGVWHIEKQILGLKIHESTGTSDLEAAELILARRIEEIRQTKVFGARPKRTFREAATKFLEENMHLASIGDYAMHLKQLDPYIGDLPLESVHLGTLQPFIEARREQGIKTKSVNLALSVVRRILNLAARLWRDESGFTWLETSPLIQMLSVTDARKPYPLSWEEQRELFQRLPDHLARMCLFKVNTGCREQEVCQLRWEWEVPVPELDTSVFIIPGTNVKNREDRLVVLNRIAKSVVEEVRGTHPDNVFTYRGHPVQSINNSSWKRVRRDVGLPQARVHDLKHTYGRRLRAARVPLETRKALLGHRNGDITTHYSAPELEELLEAANSVCGNQSGKSPALVVLKQKVVTG